GRRRSVARRRRRLAARRMTAVPTLRRVLLLRPVPTTRPAAGAVGVLLPRGHRRTVMAMALGSAAGAVGVGVVVAEGPTVPATTRWTPHNRTAQTAERTANQRSPVDVSTMTRPVNRTLQASRAGHNVNSTSPRPTSRARKRRSELPLRTRTTPRVRGPVRVGKTGVGAAAGDVRVPPMVRVRLVTIPRTP